MDSREKLLTVALTLFSEKSYEAVGVQEVCNLAKLTKPTLYHFFGSKLGLYEAVLRHYGQPYIDLCTELCVDNQNLVHSLNQLTLTMIERFSQDRPTHRLLTSSFIVTPSAEHYEVSRAFLSEFIAPIQSLFEASEKSHGNLRGKANDLTHYYTSLLTIALRLHWEGTQPSPDLAYRMVRHFMYGIFA